MSANGDNSPTPEQAHHIAMVAAETFRSKTPDVGTVLADMGLGHLLLAEAEQDTFKKLQHHRAGHICATLSLRDALTEVTAQLKEIANFGVRVD